MASFRCIELPHRRARIVRCESDDHVLVVPEHIDGLMVTEIGDGAFAGLLRVREIDLPSSVVHIGAGAFVNCIDLRRLRFPAGLKGGDPSWLIGCERLEDVCSARRGDFVFGGFSFVVFAEARDVRREGAAVRGSRQVGARFARVRDRRGQPVAQHRWDVFV